MVHEMMMKSQCDFKFDKKRETEIGGLDGTVSNSSISSTVNIYAASCVTDVKDKNAVNRPVALSSVGNSCKT